MGLLLLFLTPASANSYTYQWQRSPHGLGTWTDIAGAVTSTYVPSALDIGLDVSCLVTATNPGGSTSARSNIEGPIGGVVVVASPTWMPPANEFEMWYGRLPWPESQEVFSGTPPSLASEATGAAVWHGTQVSPERGAFAVVQVGGKFDSLVGERVRVRPLGIAARSVYLYVLDAQDIEGDISLTRRAFLQLAPLGDDALECTVTRMT